MVDYYGRWTPEEDYTNYPKEKWCDMDRIAAWVIEKGYKPKTSLQNLVEMIILSFDCADNYGEFDKETGFGGYGEEFTIEECKRYVEDSGGFAEFDYEP
jgi:hypothetical protein